MPGTLPLGKTVSPDVAYASPHSRQCSFTGQCGRERLVSFLSRYLFSLESRSNRDEISLSISFPDRLHRSASEGDELATEAGRGGTVVGPSGSNAALAPPGASMTTFMCHVDSRAADPRHTKKEGRMQFRSPIRRHPAILRKCAHTREGLPGRRLASKCSE